MSSGPNHSYEFGPYRMDPARNLLLRDAKPVPLTAKAFETLLVLVERHDQVVTKDELMQRVWPDTFVEESNLTQHISMLRKALGETAQDRHYIVTLPGKGYRFAETIRVIPENGNNQGAVLNSHPVVEIESESATAVSIPLAPPVPAIRPHKSSQTWRLFRFLPTAILVAPLVAAIVWLRPAVPAPSVVAVRQLTHVGNVLINTNLVTDGPRVYFMVSEEGGPLLRYVSADGGEIFPLRTPFSYTELMDLSANGTELLAQEYGRDAGPGRPLWRVPLPDGSPRQIADLRSDDARWSKDGRTIAFDLGADHSLYLAGSDGSNRRKIAIFPGIPFRPSWSPDGTRIRLSVLDEKTGLASVWETDVATDGSRQLLRDFNGVPRVYAGRWSEDGRYYFFVTRSGETRDIWAIREQHDWWRRSSNRPIQLTVGPVSFSQPAPSKDGKTLFAIGLQVRGQAMRYNERSRQFEPFAGGISADHFAFSSDGQYMAYIECPSGNLIRSRVDGSDRRQLTFSPMRAFFPRWSPDGKRLAFLTSPSLESSRIYVVPAAGGTPEPLVPGLAHQNVGSWSADGTALLISGVNDAHPQGALFWVDLKSRQLQFLPGSDGLSAAILSPGGRYVATIVEATNSLVLYDTRLQTTRFLVEYADDPAWSRDGSVLYFSRLNGHPGEPGIYRINLRDGKAVRVLVPDIPVGGVWGNVFSLAPDGSILVLKNVSTQDVYALDVQLP